MENINAAVKVFIGCTYRIPGPECGCNSIRIQVLRRVWIPETHHYCISLFMLGDSCCFLRLMHG